MISLNWVKDYVNLDGEDLKELAIKVTRAGVNVEKVEDKHIDNIVIGEVLECENHPDSDHLHVCKVSIGSDIKQIVCGAENVRAGIKVIVALPGAILPGNFEIKQSTIRGVLSDGMICALFELGIEEKTEENYRKGIHEVEGNTQVGTDANIYLGLDDVLYELDVHKHRNNDCYYHIGFAYEVASILNKKVTLPDVTFKEIDDNIADFMNIKVSTDKCNYYIAKMVKNVHIKESPEFIKKRLIAAGMRPINNVVDISNYVMLEYGQPLHFFDKDKLGNNILVRNAYQDEEIITLDGQKRVLSEKDIVITDGEKPVCIAGVMGGENTDVDENTTNILIESAIFDSVSIRNTASRLDLKSEASIRYGKGLSYEYTDEALKRACHLLEKYADATILSGTLKHDLIDKTPKVVTFNTFEVSNLLGLSLTDKDIEVELNRLMFEYTKGENNFKSENNFKGENNFVVTIPTRRLDIDPNVNDIAEEIGRLYGYENLVSTLPSVPIRRGVYVKDNLIRKQTSKYLRSLGLNEVKTYTLVSKEMASMFNYEEKEQITLPNPMTIDKSVLRTTLIPSLLNTYDYNKARRVDNILLYEIAKTYDKEYREDSKICMLISGNYITNDWLHNAIKCDFYVLKGMISSLLDYLGFKNRYHFEEMSIKDMHPGMSAAIILDKERIGVIGRIHPNVCKDDVFVAELSLTTLYNKSIKPLKFKESSKYPEIIKDLAFVTQNNISSDTLKDIIKKSGGRLLNNIEVFDVYEMKEENKKSIAYKLTFKDNLRTLNDEEVMFVFNKIISDVENTGFAKLRG